MRSAKTMEWVLNHLHDPNVRVIDVRFQLNNPTAGYEEFLQSHLPNAQYVDLNKDLSSKIQEHGGRHPLPQIKEITEKLSKLGIDENTIVVAYDDQNGANAARLWWILKYLGHNEVYVINGSYSKWVEKGYPVEEKVVNVSRREFKPFVQSEMLVSMEEVKERINQSNSIIIDSREPNRYLGIEEPIDLKAGHIPGAINFYWLDVMNNGKWKEVEDLQERFNSISKDQEVIVYCGSGVTACPNVLALQEAGYNHVKLYAGSWSDWISYPNNPISVKKSLS